MYRGSWFKHVEPLLFLSNETSHFVITHYFITIPFLSINNTFSAFFAKILS